MDSPPVTVPATLTEEHLRLLQVFHPYAWQKYHRAVEQRTRFVHYTSADTVMRIFQTQEVWMRNATCVNDFMEINHGFDCLQSAYKSNKEKLQAILDGLFPGFCTKLEERFNEWLPHFRSDTYIACVSEHGSEESGDEEDEIGRLSMWRAYGGITGVAVVMNGAPFLGSSSALNAYTSPVAYFSEASFGREFSKLLDGFAANAEMLGTLGEEQVLRNIFEAFRYALVCTKHPGFREEREWRVIYSPAYAKSDVLIPDIQSIRGVPQQIYKIPLKDIPDQSLVGIELHSLIDRVIVGPTQYPQATYGALVSLLEKAGMTDARKRVVVSDIPLRQFD